MLVNTQPKEEIIMLDEYGALLSFDEFCEVLQCGRNTAYRLLNSGIVGFRIGRIWKIPKADVIALLAERHSILQGKNALKMSCKYTL